MDTRMRAHTHSIGRLVSVWSTSRTSVSLLLPLCAPRLPPTHLVPKRLQASGCKQLQSSGVKWTSRQAHVDSLHAELRRGLNAPSCGARDSEWHLSEGSVQRWRADESVWLWVAAVTCSLSLRVSLLDLLFPQRSLSVPSAFPRLERAGSQVLSWPAICNRLSVFHLPAPTEQPGLFWTVK